MSSPFTRCVVAFRFVQFLCVIARVERVANGRRWRSMRLFSDAYCGMRMCTLHWVRARRLTKNVRRRRARKANEKRVSESARKMERNNKKTQRRKWIRPATRWEANVCKRFEVNCAYAWVWVFAFFCRSRDRHVVVRKLIREKDDIDFVDKTSFSTFFHSPIPSLLCRAFAACFSNFFFFLSAFLLHFAHIFLSVLKTLTEDTRCCSLAKNVSQNQKR